VRVRSIVILWTMTSLTRYDHDYSRLASPDQQIYLGDEELAGEGQ
jgi:hypothetical protein